MIRRTAWLFLLLSLIGSVAHLAAQDTDDTTEFMDPFEELEQPLPPPQFSRPSGGVGIAFGFNLTGLKPSALDTGLAGDFVLTNIDAYLILRGALRGLLIGGSWTSATLYDPGELYHEFSFDYSGLLVGYDHSLFYGKMTFRPSILIGSGGITMIRRRPDLTLDTALNPGGREVLERVRDQDFFMIRHAFGIGFYPIDLLQFRAEVAFMYPTGDGMMDDLREPTYGLQVIFGTNR